VRDGDAAAGLTWIAARISRVARLTVTTTAADQPGSGLADQARAVVDEHADQYRPLGGYAITMSVFGALFTAFLLVAGRRKRLPERYDVGDLLLLGIATYKLSRLIAKDRVTSTIRAPFTHFEDDAGQGEVSEAARGRGLRRAIGELLVCEYCLAQWVAALFIAGRVLAPRVTRATAAMFALFAISDWCQIAYSAAKARK
jgi:hypothetical protein